MSNRTPNYAQVVTARVRAAVTASALPVEQVAVRAGLSPSELAGRLEGRPWFTVREVEHVALALDLTLEDMFCPTDSAAAGNVA
jgi:transcriptional regulator with XRE-family HTH domain